MAAFFGRSPGLVAALVATLVVSAVPAHADSPEQQLSAFENEARQLGSNLPRPNQTTGAIGQRRLLDAEVAFALGNYDSAALMLFELATRPGADQETASFYLAESLFHKGDRGAARSYYEQVVAGNNVASRYYQPSLQRLIEISIIQNDDSKLADYLGALDRISAGLRLPSVPYVRGKLAYSQGKHDEALAYFQEVPKPSAYEMQAAYYTATTYVAKQDIARATDLFTELIGRKPKSSSDRRVIELSQLALGRLYYERDQFSKSIDSYLLVDRHSDLFPDALYEVAWVYVKNKQYDKALRALELLSLSDPQSQKTPTVRILEGNLRIRKAQLIRGAQLLGTLDVKSADDPAVEYDKAVLVFTETHDMYVPSYAALAQMVSSKASPAQYLTQIAGRSQHVFQTAAPIPEAAVQYLRDEPEVQRVVAVETDLGDITSNIAEAEGIIARLRGVLAAGDKTAVYPALAGRRKRIAAIQDDLIKLRNDLAEQELRLIASPGDLAQLSATRRQLYTAYSALPSAEHVAAERALQNRAQYSAIEQVAAEAEEAIGSTQAIAVALRKYDSETPQASVVQPTLRADLDDAAREAAAIEDALDVVHRDLQIGRDLAGIGDESTTTARAARRELRLAEDAEHKVLAGLAGTSKDRGKAQALVALGDRAARLSDQLDQTEAQIDGVVEQGLAEVRVALAQEEQQLAEFKKELADHEATSREIGGAALGASFERVKAKFYDIVIRTDVGNVDVSWSQKEDNDDDLKRLNLSRQRELKQLRDEFKDILDGGTAKPSAPAKTEMPQPEPNQPSGSPDKGAPEQRITPGGDKPSTQAAPTVRPDDTKADANKAGAKKPGAAKGGGR
jgi:hypothetical protein